MTASPSSLFAKSSLVRKTGSSRQRVALLLAALGILPLAGAQAGNWINTDQTWPPNPTSQNWGLATNWSGLPEGSIVYFNVQTPVNAGTSYIDSAFSIARLYMGSSTDTAGGTRGVWIASGGTLTITTNNFFLYNKGGSQLLNVASGGSLTSAGTTQLGGGGGGSAILSNSGTYSTVGMNVTVGGEFRMEGGTFNSTNTVALGVASTTNPNEARFVQTAGASTITDFQLRIGGGGTYQISGGSISATGANGYLYFGFVDANPANLGGTFQVIGSGATNIDFAGGLRYQNADDRARATWSFTLDNSAAHITKVNFGVNGNAVGQLRGGTLDVGLSGGVLLSGTNAMTLFEAPDILTSSNFVNAADFEGGTAKLWTQSIVNDTRDTLLVTLTAAADKGTLDASGGALSFAASQYGYVDLVNVNLSEPITILLDIAGGTLANFTNALTAANIDWSYGSGDYEIALDLNPQISGGNYFAWDFADIDSGMALQGISTVPEPSAGILLLGSLGVIVLLRRRSRHGAA